MGVLVTGASGGIGAACARAFAAEGARVAVHYHRGEERAHALAAELSGDGLCPLTAAVVVHEHRCALRCERTRAGRADAARGARDEDTLAGQARLHGRELTG